MGLGELDELRQKKDNVSSNLNTYILRENYQSLWAEQRTGYAA